MRAGLNVLIFVILLGVAIAIGSYMSPKPRVETSGSVTALYNAEKDWYEANPFLVEKKMTPGAKAVVPLETYDFKTMEIGLQGEHGFVIRNEGTVPLKLAKGRTQCKCTLSKLENDEIPPGGEAVINLAWEPKELGEFFQQAVIYTSDPDRPEIQLGTKGTMFSPVEVSPEQGWLLGMVGTEPTALEGYLYSRVQPDLQITGVRTSSDHVQLTYTAIDPDEAPFPQCKAAFRLTGQLLPPDKAGRVQEEVILLTNEPRYSEVKLTVTADRAGPFSVVGRGWFAQDSSFNLGRVAPDKGKTFKFLLVLSPGVAPFEIQSAVAEPGFLKVSMKPIGETAPHNRYEIEIQVPPNSPTGVWTSGDPGSIKIAVNHPEFRELVFKVVLDVH